MDAAEPEMVQCEITGAWVPADETVEFRGRRVSAAGKQILFERLEAGDAMPGELETAGQWLRLGCGILDSLIIGVVSVPLALLVRVLVVMNVLSLSELSIVLLESALAIVTSLITFAYFWLMHARLGRTVGKMAGRLKVVRPNGSAISSGQAASRAAVYALPNLLPVAATFALATTQDLFLIKFGTNVALAAVGLFGLANLITILCNPLHRAIHDFLAGTRVIRTQD